MLRNRLYVGDITSRGFSVSRRGDFEPLVTEELFYGAQAVLDRRVVVAGPRARNHPDFPLRGFVRCETCERPLTGSWSKGRDRHYAYYHCQRQCRAVNITKAKLEASFVEELRLLQPSAGYMRLVNDRILAIWQGVRFEVRERAAEADRNAKALQQKLDRLDDAFLFAKSIDQTTYERQRDKTRQELTLAQMDRHAEQLEEFDVEGLLAFRRAHSTEGGRHVGAGLARSKAAAAIAVFPRGDRVRWNSI